MLTTPIGLSVDELDTPALLVDLDRLDRNIAFIAGHLRERGVNWRPHAKAHKSPAVAHRQVAAGAIGITCAKLSEAEVYVAAGIRDILVANQIVGPIKTRRLAALARESEIKVAVDHIDQVTAIDEAAAIAGSRPGIVIEVNSGMNRAGSAPGAATVTLANQIAALKHVRFEGLMTWEGHTMAIADPDVRITEIQAAVGRFVDTGEQVRASGVPVGIMSCGGTGTFLTTSELSGITEVQAGGGIFGDVVYRALGVPVEAALSVLVTVTSRPAPDRFLIDAGRKTIDPSAQAPGVVGMDNVAQVALSAEHGNVTLAGASDCPKIGDRLRLEVGYSDQLVHLHEQLIALRDDRVTAIWPTLARGRLQ
jgi:D-serine deaminase-like pyridoxal phosphate-dependent protein